MWDKLLGVSAAVFAARAALIVERELEAAVEAARARSEETFVAPHIEDAFALPGTPEEHDAFKARIVRALLAQKGFAECEAPPWAGTLPITEDGIVALLNGANEGKRRPYLVVEYGRTLRALGWHIERAMPFEEHSAHLLIPSPEPRRRGRPRRLQSW
jgi:hypothetical protein